MTVENLFVFASGHRGSSIFARVFERYPDLRYAITEIATHWVPQRLRELDFVWGQARMEGMATRTFSGPAADNLPLKPSEYFARNCYLGASFMLPYENVIRHEIGLDRIMWGSDFPHSEGTYPYTREALRVRFAWDTNQ